MIVPPVSSKGSVRPSCGDGGRLGPSETYDGASRAVLYGPASSVASGYRLLTRTCVSLSGVENF